MIQLRPFQKEALQALGTVSSQSQSHVLCIAPTGSGKSLIYEEASAEKNRKTLLITPLVALARQQFEKLKKRKLPVTLGAGGEGAGPPPTETGAWIISPETLRFSSRQDALKRWKPNLLVVDECHCLWEWGEDFRPAFTLIPELLKTYSITQSLWLTATLPYPARLNLRELLPQPLIELGSFRLPQNLLLFVNRIPWPMRTEVLLNWIRQQKEPGIVFAPTRESTLRLSRLIGATGLKVVAYHAGMSKEERKNVETQVMHKIPDVVVATSAFGMGMDYPHLQYVVLWQAPPSLLSLVQTIGRVGRNPDAQGRALVLWDYDDFRLLEWTVQNSDKRRKELIELMEFLQSEGCRQAALKKYFDRVPSPSGYSLGCSSCHFCLDQKLREKKALGPQPEGPY